MVLVQKWPSFQLFFLGNIDKENVFYDILERKNAFIDYKLKKFKKSKNWHFSKGLTHGFSPKIAIFPTSFFLGNIDQENVSHDILERKNAFLGYKNKKLKKIKNWHFSRVVNPWFWSKNVHFSNFFFFRQDRPGKFLLRILERKNAFLDYKNKTFKKSNNWHFSNVVNPWFWSKNGHFSNFFF